MSEIIKRRVLTLKRNSNALLLAGIFYLGGVIIGVIYFLSNSCDAMFFRHVVLYYNNIVDCSVSPLSVFFTRIAVNIGYILIVLALSFTVFTYPLILLFIAYRGAIIGAVAGIFISAFGFNGGAVFFTVTLPQNLVVTVGIIACATLNFDYMLNRPHKCKAESVKLITNCLFGLAICAIAAVYELFLTVILIRPMNFYF